MNKVKFHKKANERGYYQISQLKVGGMCGCCGKHIPDLIWADEGGQFDDIGVCQECKDAGDDIISMTEYGDGHINILTNKKRHAFMAEMGKIMFMKERKSL
jgi:hypothetical protein